MTRLTTHEDKIDQRLTELEIKASFSEDLLDQLNLVIVRQQAQIDLLIREVKQLREQQADGVAGGKRIDKPNPVTANEIGTNFA
jgi:SlyX protein